MEYLYENIREIPQATGFITIDPMVENGRAIAVTGHIQPGYQE